MKLKTLLIVVALLAAASAAVYFVNRPTAPAPADARVGQPLLDPAVVEPAARFTLKDAGNTVELVKSDGGVWQVASFHHLPADLSKLSRFVQDLTEAKIDRFVTSNPERLARLEFKDTQLSFADAAGKELWSIDLGKTAEGGGRFVRYGDEEKAYRTRLNAWLDTTARNWADSSLVGAKPEQIAKVEIPLAEGEAITVSRGEAGQPWTADGTPEDRQLRQSSIDSLLSTLTNLRFIETASADAPEVTAAREHQRRVTLTTFSGETLEIALGRKPEETVVKPAAPKPETSGPAAIVGSATEAPKPEEAGPAAVTEATTETIPAGPVFAFVTGPATLAKLSGAPEDLAFKVSDYVFTSLPKSRDELLEPKAPAPTEAADKAGQADSPPAPAPSPETATP